MRWMLGIKGMNAWKLRTGGTGLVLVSIRLTGSNRLICMFQLTSTSTSTSTSTPIRATPVHEITVIHVSKCIVFKLKWILNGKYVVNFTSFPLFQ